VHTLHSYLGARRCTLMVQAAAQSRLCVPKDAAQSDCVCQRMQLKADCVCAKGCSSKQTVCIEGCSSKQTACTKECRRPGSTALRLDINARYDTTQNTMLEAAPQLGQEGRCCYTLLSLPLFPGPCCVCVPVQAYNLRPDPSARSKPHAGMVDMDGVLHEAMDAWSQVCTRAPVCVLQALPRPWVGCSRFMRPWMCRIWKG